MPISVTFDSNVWRKIVSPDSFPKDLDAAAYRVIHSAIRNGKVKGYLGDSMFHLEAIPKKIRPEYFGEYKSNFESKVIDTDHSGMIHMRVSIGSSTEGHSGNSDYLKRHLEDALSLRFTLLSSPRIGTPRNPDVLRSYYGDRNEVDIGLQQKLCFDVFATLNELGCGIAVAKALGDSYKRGELTWMEALDNVPETEHHLVAKAIAEWADGDSIAGHISYGLDYFCTLDRGVSAGSKSVFSPANRAILEDRYQIRFVTPSELREILAREC
jgi:hypothetical protein